jgi:hypothetical protein
MVCYLYVKTKNIMNKKLVLFLFAVLSSAALVAQAERAIGVRFGAGGEVSYQHPLGESNRVELDLGLSPQSFGLNGIYHWVNDLSEWTDGMSWYYGPGATIGFSNTSPLFPTREFALGVVGQIGLEYKFDFPLQLTIDYRPTFYLVRNAGTGGNYNDICLSARYRF